MHAILQSKDQTSQRSFGPGVQGSRGFLTNPDYAAPSHADTSRQSSVRRKARGGGPAGLPLGFSAFPGANQGGRWPEREEDMQSQVERNVAGSYGVDWHAKFTFELAGTDEGSLIAELHRQRKKIADATAVGRTGMVSICIAMISPALSDDLIFDERII
jgi:hypothetical protein